MSNYSHVVRETVEYFDNNPYQINVVIIKRDIGKFIIGEFIHEIKVYDSNMMVKCFNTQVSPNQKELIGFFTSDAFETFTGNVTIEFGYNPNSTGTISNIDIQNIQAMDPLLASLNAPEGDKNWLDSIS